MLSDTNNEKSNQSNLVPGTTHIGLLSQLEKIAFQITENLELSIEETMKLFDINFPYSYNLIIINLVYSSFSAQITISADADLNYLETIQAKEKVMNINNPGILKMFGDYISQKKTQESYYLIESMIEKGLIDKNILKKNFNNQSNYFIHYEKNTEKFIELSETQNEETFKENIKELSKNDWELHKKLIKEGHNPNEIAKIIRNDEIEKLQEISSQTNFDFNQKIEPSLYERCSFINQENVTLIDYAAFFGSVKCFKYLLMNGANVINTGKYAVAGGNEEIIHLCEQNHSSFEDSYETAIKFHRNDIFKYLYENKFEENYRNKIHLEMLGHFCIHNGNYEIFEFWKKRE